ncbi:MAG: peptide chain release factor N(5)-glutamine methyltransferase [Desulfobacula sp.]|uniref:peptide chain release factor N(5)-glutamine methyltransferase n=1 Tax=Desulfobacula sp. TaxID=2593537 RepID=UPI001D222D8B|nr:peptide chain release factor N(5)-glutamine methyltransferase [Desulfobacula sp.]MBT3484510.1 peptide chain release factor N(5)-glutamine methyltransferase [Desulfobacula sp.]MBT3803148.1 peptide chain release factor N(5)-glutamine methyltransferase [Desulfobacula sp.]MBT4024718.1 peptide chain release factor N(5)-glutamine methyltransferase [Desulfobacula sp.]MBT4197196.1 peptide chain release factor N(5)-glutamine methyltransferase [Desulfobacula sp.]
MNDWTIIKILSWTESYLKKHSIDSPRLTAETLLAYCLGAKRLDLYLQHDRPLQKNELSDFKALIKRRIQNEPVAYIIGKKGFFESDFDVAKGVLIPRPDTETLVEQALKILNIGKGNPGPRMVLELGTGSGAIIVSLAKAIPNYLYFAVDISVAALAIAKKNAEKIAKNQIRFFAGSWFSSLRENSKFDLIVSNPPYIPTTDIQDLQPEIKKFEPILALDGGKEGSDSFRSILKNAYNYLVPGGSILLEIGFDQSEMVQSISEQYTEYRSVDFIKDLAGHSRVALIKKID